MSSFEIVNSRDHISLPPEWIETKRFNNTIRLVNERGTRVSHFYRGNTYRLISQRELHYTFIQRVGRCFLYALAILISLGFALLFESVRNLLKEKRVVIYGMPHVVRKCEDRMDEEPPAPLEPPRVEPPPIPFSLFSGKPLPRSFLPLSSSVEDENGKALPRSFLGELSDGPTGHMMSYLSFTELLSMRGVNKKLCNLSKERKLFNEEARTLDTLMGNEPLHCIYNDYMGQQERDPRILRQILGDYLFILPNGPSVVKPFQVRVICLSTKESYFFTIDRPITSCAVILEPEPTLLLIALKNCAIKKITLADLNKLWNGQVKEIEFAQLPDYEQWIDGDRDRNPPWQIVAEGSLVAARFSDRVIVKDVINKQRCVLPFEGVRQIILQDRKLVALSQRMYTLFLLRKNGKGEDILTPHFKKRLSDEEWRKSISAPLWMTSDIRFKFAALSSSALVVSYKQGRNIRGSGIAVGEVYDFTTGKSRELVDHSDTMPSFFLRSAVIIERREKPSLEGSNKYRIFGGSFSYNQWSDRGGLSEVFKNRLLFRHSKDPVFVMEKISCFVFSARKRQALLHLDSRFDAPKLIDYHRFGIGEDSHHKNSRIVSMNICNARYLVGLFATSDPDEDDDEYCLKVFDLAPSLTKETESRRVS